MWDSDLALALSLAANAALLGLACLAWVRWRRGKGDPAQGTGSDERLQGEIARREAAEAELQQQRQWAAAARSANIGFYVWDLVENRCLYCTEEFARIHGLSVEEYMTDYAAIDRDTLLVHPDDRAYYRQSTKSGVQAERRVDIEYRIVTKTGEVRHVREVEHNYVVEQGTLLRSIGVLQDISESKRAKSWLTEALDAVAPLFALYDAEDRLVSIDSKYRKFLGLREDSLTAGLTFEEVLRQCVDRFRPDDTPDQQEAWIQKRLQRRQTPARHLEVRLANGAWVEMNDVLLADGGVLTIGIEITRRKEMETRLQQAQRMEAVGQLTSGLAHDFNNLLGIIHGNAELLAERQKQQDALLDAILHAAQRGAELTHRLLAFSRQQPLRPRAVDLSALIERLKPQLERTLGDAVTVTVSCDADLWPAMADPGQLENALLNLTLNAREAMDKGGVLSIVCGNAAPASLPADHDLAEGDYVRIEVNDNGRGMAPEVLARAFEPFFTTDETTQSSGLGLSMIYGFARQSGGLVRLESDRGQGTRAELLLPRARAAVARDARDVQRSDESPRGKGELVLVVDDNKPVRAMAAALVERMGYQAVQAACSADALTTLKTQPVALALVDIVLADDVSGPVFAEQAREIKPDMPVIFMSGYSAEAASLSGFLKDGSTLLTKPFRYRVLAAALDDALRQRQSRAATEAEARGEA